MGFSGEPGELVILCFSESIVNFLFVHFVFGGQVFTDTSLGVQAKL